MSWHGGPARMLPKTNEVAWDEHEMCTDQAAVRCFDVPVLRIYGGEVPSRAYDGDFTNWFSSDSTANPWISFRLNSIYADVAVVQLWARSDTYWNQVDNVTVAVSAAPGPFAGTICATNITATASVRSFNISCPPTPSVQWVTVYRANASSVVVSVGEIKVARGGCMALCNAPGCHSVSVDHRRSSPTCIPAMQCMLGAWHGPTTLTPHAAVHGGSHARPVCGASPATPAACK